MRTTTIIAPSHTGTDELTEEQRFALLAARTGLEPSLAERYITDPVSVLAEFGLAAAEPVYSHGLAIEDLAYNGESTALSSWCTGCKAPQPPQQPLPKPSPPQKH